MDKLLEPLTPREREVLEALMRHQGSLTQAADELCIEVSTAKTHLQHLYEKTQCNNKMALLLRALRLGIVSI